MSILAATSEAWFTNDCLQNTYLKGMQLSAVFWLKLPYVVLNKMVEKNIFKKLSFLLLEFIFCGLRCG